MKFEDYQDQLRPKYSEFAEIITLILNKAIEGTDGCARPQQVQHRAKSLKSLADKLLKRGIRDAEGIEDKIKDLAGVRPIFYTNLDAERFLETRLIHENFDVVSATIHHPTEQNDKQDYRAIHYVVRLKEDRIGLPEYAKFAGMKCEIQVQTTLNHAWSETSHDMIYKAKTSPGFGTAAHKDIERRLKNVMNKYLLLAGYEFQQIQYDYERLQEGRALFDRGTLETLAACPDNNERRTVLETIKQHVLNYDDPKGIYPELASALVAAVDAARVTPIKPIETPFGNLTGTKPEAIEMATLGIIEELAYVDVRITFKTFCALYKSATTDEQRRHILKSIERLANYHIEIWRRAGAYVQEQLLAAIVEMTSVEKDALLPIITTVCQQALDPELDGVNWSADTVSISRGAVIATDQLKAVRKSAIDILEERYSQVQGVSDKSRIKSALRTASRLPSVGDLSPDICATVLADVKRIVEMQAAQMEGQPYELLESIEDDLQRNYWRAKEIAGAKDDKYRCRELTESLQASVIAFRDHLNADTKFVRFKILVGFQGQFERDWETDEYWDTEPYRQEKAQEFVSSINEKNEPEWIDLINTCAAVKSDDMATFPIFAHFLRKIGEQKPDFALRVALGANEDMQRFIPSLLAGLSEAPDQSGYNKLTEELLTVGRDLEGLARHIWSLKNPSSFLLKRTFDKAIEAQNDFAIMACLIACFRIFTPERREILNTVLEPALRYVVAKKHTGWRGHVYFMRGMEGFYETLSRDQAQLLVNSLLPVRRVDHDSEAILRHVAVFHPDLIWEFFEKRLSDRPDDEDWYEAIPYEFHEIRTVLAENASVAVDYLRRWYTKDDPMFRHEGGRMLHSLYPVLTDQLVQKLSEIANGGSDDDLAFVFALLANYRFDADAHPVLKAIIRTLPAGDKRLNRIHNGLASTGVVTGPFGIVRAHQARRNELAAWQDDTDTKIRTFAENAIRLLDNSIAYEQQAEEKRIALRNLQYGNSAISDNEDGDDFPLASNIPEAG